jgi:hypothetical protein
MALKAGQIFIHEFQAGASESSSIGYGAMVGFDAYTKKGAVILGKKVNSLTQFGGTNEYAVYTDVSDNSNGTPALAISGRLWVQTNIGNVYYCDNYTSATPTFTQAAGTDAQGNGLIVYENWVFAFSTSNIRIAKANIVTPTFGDGTVTSNNWKASIGNGTTGNPNTSPISYNHYPYLFPNNRGFYFGNSNCVGFVGQVFPVGATLPTFFDPTLAINTNYLYNNIVLTLPSNYLVNVLDFVAPSNLAIGATNLSATQEADIFTWDTISSNKFSAPIKLYGRSNIAGSQGVKQFVNSNNVLYAATSGNHNLYATNGSTAKGISDLSLYATIRDVNVNSNGKEYPLPVYYNSYPNAMTASGGRILTGTAASTNNSYYPMVGSGIFPIGVWSIYINDSASQYFDQFIEQMDYVVPFAPGLYVGAGSVWAQAGNQSGITTVKMLPTGNLVAGWLTQFGASPIVGSLSIFDPYNYIQDITNTSLESELYEIGTPLVPQTISNIEINLIKNLLTGQTIEISYRTSTDKEWIIIQTFTGDGTTNQYKITKNPIGATQYIQFRIRAATTSSFANDSPEIRTVIIT